MHRGFAFRKRFAWLSLTAALLLALLPSVGRLAASHDVAPRTLLMEMCTAGSETLIRVVDPVALLDTPQRAPMEHGDTADCAYCPLLATAVLALLWWACALQLPAMRPRACPPPVRGSPRHPCGLGSRGPPLAA